MVINPWLVGNGTELTKIWHRLLMPITCFLGLLLGYYHMLKLDSLELIYSWYSTLINTTVIHNFGGRWHRGGGTRRRGKACESGCQMVDISREVQLSGIPDILYPTTELLARCQPSDTRIHTPFLSSSYHHLPCHLPPNLCMIVDLSSVLYQL